MLNVIAFLSGGQPILAFDKEDGTTVAFLEPKTGELVFDPDLEMSEALTLLPQIAEVVVEFTEQLRRKVEAQDAERAAEFAVGMTAGLPQVKPTVYLN